MTSSSDVMVGSSAKHILTDMDDETISPPDEYLLVYDETQIDGLVLPTSTSVTSDQVLAISIVIAGVLERFHRRGALFGSLSTYSIYIPKIMTQSDPNMASSFQDKIRISPLGVPLVASGFRSQYPPHARTSSDEMQAFVAVIQELADASTNATECEPILNILRGSQSASLAFSALRDHKRALAGI
jgi:hypothetical protein